MRRNGISLIKFIIAIFVIITIGLMISSWFINTPSDSKNNLDNGKFESFQQDKEQNNIKISGIDKPDLGSQNDEKENEDSLKKFNELELAQKERVNQLNPRMIQIDWHDKNAIAIDQKAKGLGEQGKPAHLASNLADEERKLFGINGFSGLLSDNISLNRSLPDIRYYKCKTKKYLKILPTVSVIIPFFNEHFSTLLRSVYSILNRSPEHLVKEIILVDDFSDRKSVKKQLDDYITKHLPKVKVVRLPERSGLILARLAGGKVATAEVLIFLDSHIECNVNWLPPLLEPIALNPKASVCPFIDVIDHDTFEYRSQDEGARGAFDWEFYYKRLPLLPEDLADRTKPFKSPVMAGGLFAIGTKFFWELGGYDDGLDIWGGEQYELSFKIWMCGGELLDAPCSRVGHIYRGPMNPRKPVRKGDYLHKNYKRVAEVWMDEYAKYLYERNPIVYNNIDAGDLTQQKAIREKLKCKSFKWFMDNIAFDLPKKYPPVEPPDYAFGTIKSIATPSLCLDTLGKKKHEEIGLYPCASNAQYPQSSQNWALSWHKDLRIRRRTDCLDISQSHKDSPVVLYECHGQQGNQLWFYEHKSKWLIHGKNMRCLEAFPDKRKVYINNCDDNNPNMKWEFGFVNHTALKRYYIEGPQDDL